MFNSFHICFHDLVRPQGAPIPSRGFKAKLFALQFHGISLISGQPATYHLETPHHPVGSMMLYTILYHSYIIVIYSYIMLDHPII